MFSGPSIFQSPQHMQMPASCPVFVPLNKPPLPRWIVFAVNYIRKKRWKSLQIDLCKRDLFKTEFLAPKVLLETKKTQQAEPAHIYLSRGKSLYIIWICLCKILCEQEIVLESVCILLGKLKLLSCSLRNTLGAGVPESPSYTRWSLSFHSHYVHGGA